MQSATVTRIVQQFGLDAVAVLPTEKGYRNESHPVRLPDGSLVNVILYKREPDMLQTIQRLNAVSGFLHECGFPVRYALDGRLVRVSSGGLIRFAGLYTYLPGQTISWEAYTRKHIKLLGKVMSDMHAALTGYDGIELPDVSAVYDGALERMERYYTGAGVRQAARQKLLIYIPTGRIGRYRQLVCACSRLKSRQPLHMDFVRSNILFRAGTASEFGLEIAGILDFEKVAFGHPAFDIARTLAFLLVDCKYTSVGKVRKYFLFSGYQKRGANALRQPYACIGNRRVKVLDMLVDMFLLYDLYKFMRHNPYESLQSNEHFVRTRDLLLAHGVISTTVKR